MSVFQSILLGIIQGLGEFLPISSTAHLILLHYFFGWRDPGLSFDVALHLGTLAAVLAYFYSDWINIIKSAFRKSQRPDDRPPAYNQNLLWLLVIATIPGMLAGYFLESQAETIFRHPLLIAITLSFVGFVLYLADRKTKKAKDLQSISRQDAIWIGAAQALAIIPGVSRSGATITAGLLAGLDRPSAARFSFLLSTPIIFGASVLKIPYLVQGGITLAAIVGIFASALSGYLAIKYLLKFVEKSSYSIFFFYRLTLAAIIVLVYFLR